MPVKSKFYLLLKHKTSIIRWKMETIFFRPMGLQIEQIGINHLNHYSWSPLDAYLIGSDNNIKPQPIKLKLLRFRLAGSNWFIVSTFKYITNFFGSNLRELYNRRSQAQDDNNKFKATFQMIGNIFGPQKLNNLNQENFGNNEINNLVTNNNNFCSGVNNNLRANEEVRNEFQGMNQFQNIYFDKIILRVENWHEELECWVLYIIIGSSHDNIIKKIYLSQQ
ncbi:UNKNOWN [Stylonychia lemnae]|uniref:Uncharacterized protein n=1 Tax=Stylonychia lemnae TaxID=5949 RepID=A0A078AKL9_STYLE|nr:UNKNOWN [Stylonychia lemnae]|eukprot:CDW82431.1 UNKNOWN [Stylonychia lemnae]